MLRLALNFKLSKEQTQEAALIRQCTALEISTMFPVLLPATKFRKWVSGGGKGYG